MRRDSREGAVSEMDRLKQIMARLRGPDGCPWDREQTLDSLATFLLEETHEVLDAMGPGTPDAHREELGDLLFQIVFQARVAEEDGAFDLEAVMRDIGDKIVRRHPHVFGDASLETSDQVLKQWEQIKVEERRAKGEDSMFSGVPRHLPALLKALRISSQAAQSGCSKNTASGRAAGCAGPARKARAGTTFHRAGPRRARPAACAPDNR